MKHWAWKRKARAGFLLAVAAFAGARRASASIALLLEQPYGKLGIVDPSGHSAVYLDHVCADGPLKLRRCAPGELGVVLSRYDGIGGYDWLAMPLIPYLYGVETAAEIPQTMDRPGEIALRDRYRRAHLELVAPDTPEGKAPDGNWYELVGSAYDRTIYGFNVKTTSEQDDHLIALFNDSRNKQRYNGMWVNCADFVRVTINRFYPHAIHRNFIADLGMTSPKSAARALSHYAKKHPETEFKTFLVPQVKGSLPRSRAVVNAAEGVLKQYSVPILILSPTTAGVVLVAYLAQGRFHMPKDAPLLDLQAAPPSETPVAGSTIEPAVASGGGIPPVSSSIAGGRATGAGKMMVVAQ